MERAGIAPAQQSGAAQSGYASSFVPSCPQPPPRQRRFCCVPLTAAVLDISCLIGLISYPTLPHPTPSYPVLSRPILSCPVLCLSIARNWGMSTPNISSLTEKAPCLQLLNSHKTTAGLVARGTPGHISVVPGGKVHVTGRMDLLSHLSHITFSMHTEHQQGGAGFGTVESDQEQALPALQPSAVQPLSDSKGRVPRSLSACHYIPGRV